MKNTLSKFFPAKLEYDDPAAGRSLPWAFPMTGGSFKKEKIWFGKTEVVDEQGKNRGREV
jgi:hypothetical protein